MQFRQCPAYYYTSFPLDSLKRPVSLSSSPLPFCEMPSSPPQPGTVNKVTIQRGLDGQDDNLDLLQSYFKELKAVTVEPSPPELDLLTFAICTHYFGVIISTEHKQEVDQEVDEDAEGEPEDDSLDAASPPPVSFDALIKGG